VRRGIGSFRATAVSAILLGVSAEYPRRVQAARLHYDQQSYKSAEDCLDSIRFRVRGGWEVTEVERLERGYRVVFRLIESSPPAADSAPPSGSAGGPR
jgi:hypothetical protein